jgi:hypothetical protein
LNEKFLSFNLNYALQRHCLSTKEAAIKRDVVLVRFLLD